jgi:hypothetical protein
VRIAVELRGFKLGASWQLLDESQGIIDTDLALLIDRLLAGTERSGEALGI